MKINKNIVIILLQRSIIRVDKGKVIFEKDHIHIEEGYDLNYDGTWKHGKKILTKQEIQ